MSAEQSIKASCVVGIFKPEFAQAAIELILPIQQQEFGIKVTLDDQPDLQNVVRFYQEKGGNFWVATYSGKVVGTIGLLNIGNQQGALRKMFVAKEYRGKMHGVAKALLDELLQWSRENGFREIFLGTTDKYLAAHRFYEKSGFARIAAEELPPSFPRMAVDSIFYWITTN